jgi:NADPH-dependent 2,4-dienoyl-CoA reductase/sulfur reductase-like enzyme
MRFPLEVVKAVRRAIGDKPLLYRMTVSDSLEGGTTVEDAEQVAPRLCEAGVDAIDISCGSLDRIDVIMEPMSVQEGVRLPMARRIRAATGKPVLCAGVMRHPDKAEAAIVAGDIDVVSLGRALLADPLWPAKAKAGRVDDIRPCTSCNWCILELGANRSVGCAENPRTGHETDPPMERFGQGRRAAVVGAGPGGMAAALLLDQCGFAVELYEKRASLGGNLITSATPPGKDKLFWYHRFLERRIAASGVTVHLNAEVDAEMLAARQPDVVIIATGASLAPLQLEGSGLPVAPAYAALLGDFTPPKGEPGRPIVVFGGGETGAETAEFLAALGRQVLLVTRSGADKIARNAEGLYRQHLVARLRDNPAIEIVDHTRVVAISEGGVTLLGPNGETRDRAASCLLLAHGLAPDTVIADALAGTGPVVVSIGDCRRVARIGEAVNEAYRAVQGLRRSLGAEDPIAC